MLQAGEGYQIQLFLGQMRQAVVCKWNSINQSINRSELHLQSDSFFTFLNCQSHLQFINQNSRVWMKLRIKIGCNSVGDAVPGALRRVPLLPAGGQVSAPGEDMDRGGDPQFQGDEPVDSIHLRPVLVHYHNDNRRLRRHARRQRHGDDLHHLLHALQPRPHRLLDRQHDQSRRRRHSPHHGIREP